MRENLGVAQFGRALEWGSRGRRFNSCHPDISECSSVWYERLVRDQEAAGSSPVIPTHETRLDSEYLGGFFSYLKSIRQMLGVCWSHQQVCVRQRIRENPEAQAGPCPAVYAKIQELEQGPAQQRIRKNPGT